MRIMPLSVFVLSIIGCHKLPVSGSEIVLVNGDGWGDPIKGAAEFYAANDVSPEVVEITKRWHEIGVNAWGNYGPLEFWIVGSSALAAKELEEKYAAVRAKKDPLMPAEVYGNRDFGFESYAEGGNAGLSYMRNKYENWCGYVITMSASSPSPEEEDYKPVVLHEYFHVYQNAHIYSRDEDERASRNLKNPWWAEGGAEYMAQLLYSRQKGVRDNYLREVMLWKLRSLGSLDSGQRIQDFTYDQPETIVAYDLGAWFIAFLISKTSEEAYRINFFKDLNEKGFRGSFLESFGAPPEDFLDEFHGVFLPSSLENKLEIIPSK